jgi:hypothetical protein
MTKMPFVEDDDVIKTISTMDPISLSASPLSKAVNCTWSA